MKRHSQAGISAVLCTAMLALFAGSILMLRAADQQRPEDHLEDALYIPSAKALKRMSLGYNGLLADIYWTRAVQYFGWRHKHRATDYHLLYPLLDITTQLDPNLLVAYRFGATFLAQQPPDGAGQPDLAAELIERGIKANPKDWRLYYDLGFLEAMEREDYTAAAAAFERGSKLSNAHPFLRILAANMAQHGGDLGTARMMWETTLATTDDPALRMNAQMHLKALEVDETVPKLKELVRQYKVKTGEQPANFFPLVQAGYLRHVPIDPLGHPYKLLADGQVEVQDPEALSFIRQGLPPKSSSQAPEKQ
jgi:tetratricopeptide (TPR) repeat protein